MLDLYKNVTITIVIYQESFEILSKCLINVNGFKIIIIDNAGNYKLKEEILKKYKIFKYIINSSNLGFSKATNQAIKLVDTQYALSMQADCIISVESINKLYFALNKYDNCILVTPTFYDKKDNLTYSGGPLPEKKIEIKILNLEADTCVDIATTAAILFRKEDLINIGLFDEDFFIYYPDFEIGRRIKNYNKSIIQVFEAKAIHVMGNLKIKNIIKKTFFRNYYFTIDELIYYHKGEDANFAYLNLKKKIPILIFKIFLNLIILRFAQSTKFLGRILAFYKFKNKFINKDFKT